MPVFNGTSGADTLSGTNSNDIIKGEDGEDSLVGLGGDDSIVGGSGSDVLSGDDGADSLYGQGHNDSIWGGSGNDYVSGGHGSDLIFAGNGDDTLQASSGEDTLFGERGDDVFVTSHWDVSNYIGGEGADRYIVNIPSAQASILDFDPENDIIDITPTGVRYDALVFEQRGDDVVITNFGSGRFYLRNFDIEDISPDMFRWDQAATIENLETEQTFAEDELVSLDFSEVVISDVDSDAVRLWITARGTINLEFSVADGDAYNVDVYLNEEYQYIILRGSPQDVTRYLNAEDSIQFVPQADASGDDILTITISGDGIDTGVTINLTL